MPFWSLRVAGCSLRGGGWEPVSMGCGLGCAQPGECPPLKFKFSDGTGPARLAEMIILQTGLLWRQRPRSTANKDEGVWATATLTCRKQTQTQPARPLLRRLQTAERPGSWHTPQVTQVMRAGSRALGPVEGFCGGLLAQGSETRPNIIALTPSFSRLSLAPWEAAPKGCSAPAGFRSTEVWARSAMASCGPLPPGAGQGGQQRGKDSSSPQPPPPAWPQAWQVSAPGVRGVPAGPSQVQQRPSTVPSLDPKGQRARSDQRPPWGLPFLPSSAGSRSPVPAKQLPGAFQRSEVIRRGRGLRSGLKGGGNKEGKRQICHRGAQRESGKGEPQRREETGKGWTVRVCPPPRVREGPYPRTPVPKTQPQAPSCPPVLSTLPGIASPVCEAPGSLPLPPTSPSPPAPGPLDLPVTRLRQLCVWRQVDGQGADRGRI